tara:strand:- start:120 stop:1214 length:1095 start_codon:yes stop_codon:yes gene_type:complete
MNKLSVYTSGRENNFNIIRFIAASMVLFTHSYALYFGTGEAEPLRDFLGMTIGTLAVDAFFITSGFLITSSFFRQNNIVSFIVARALRIYPALIFSLLVTILLIGPYFTIENIEDYFSDPGTSQYFFRNSILFFGVDFSLVGVFTDTPYPNNVNGSLWTMPYEVRMYFFLAVIGIMLGVFKRYFFDKKFISIFWLLLAVFSIASYYFSISDVAVNSKFFRLFSMFFIGVSLFYFKHLIPLTIPLFLGAILMLCTIFYSQDGFHFLYILAFPYIVIFLAYFPKGWILNFNKVGDYSYGIYIYAWPVQQSLISVFPHVNLTEYIIYSFFITLSFAYVSWNFVEVPALGLKTKFSKISPQQKKEINN